jgi:hypothetical protein
MVNDHKLSENGGCQAKKHTEKGSQESEAWAKSVRDIAQKEGWNGQGICFGGNSRAT